MMKRIPKGTLKVTESELDGCEPHVKSKRVPFVKSYTSSAVVNNGAPSGSLRAHGIIRSGINTTTTTAANPLHAAGHALISRGSRDAEEEENGSVLESPTSPTDLPTAGPLQSSQSFPFLRRPLLGSSHPYARKSTSVSKRLAQVTTYNGSGGVNDGIGSGDRDDGAPTHPMTVQKKSRSVGKHEPLLMDLMNESMHVETAETNQSRSPCQTLPSSAESSFASSPDSMALHPPYSKQNAIDLHLLGIRRPCYNNNHDLPTLDPNLIVFENGGEDDFVEAESEIIFECSSPDTVESSRKKQQQQQQYSLFEQSWMSQNSDEDDLILDHRERRSPTQFGKRDTNSKAALDVTAGTRENLRHDESAQGRISTRTGRSSALQSDKTSFEEEESRDGKFSPSSHTHASIASATQNSFPVPTITSESSSSIPSNKIFVLLLQPQNKIFELIQLTYPVQTTTLASILGMIPGNATEPVLAAQSYIGITRPKRRSPDFCDLTLMASETPGQHTYHSICLEPGEVVIAIPTEYDRPQLVRLAKKILSNARIQSLLERSCAKVGKKSMRTSPVGEVDGEAVSSDSTLVVASTEYEEGIQRALANATVANAAVSRNPTSSRSLSTKTNVQARASLSRNLASTTHDFAVSHSSRPQLANSTFASVSGASSVSSASSLSSLSRVRRFAAAAKMQEKSLLDSTTLPSSVSVSSFKRNYGYPFTQNTVQPEFSSILYDTTNEASVKTKSSPSTNFHASSVTVNDTSFSIKTKPFTGTSIYSSIPAEATKERTNPIALARDANQFFACTSKLSRPLFESLSTPTSLESSDSSYLSGSNQKDVPLSRKEKPVISKVDDTFDAVLLSRNMDSQRSESEFQSNAAQQSVAGISSSFVSYVPRTTLSPRYILRKRKQQRTIFAANLTWGLAVLILSLTLRFYTDPNGYALSAVSRRLNGDSNNNNHQYHPPLGIVGGLQMAVIFYLLVKFQQAFTTTDDR